MTVRRQSKNSYTMDLFHIGKQKKKKNDKMSNLRGSN